LKIVVALGKTHISGERGNKIPEIKNISSKGEKKRFYTTRPTKLGGGGQFFRARKKVEG